MFSSSLPLAFQERILSLLETVGSKPSLVAAREQLAKRYRAPQSTLSQAGFASPSEAIAYVATRVPATFASMTAALSHVPLKNVTSVLDLGAGPGTATLAAALHWPECRHFHLMEGDAFMSAISQDLLRDIPEIAHQSFSFEQANLLTVSIDLPFDIALLSYVLNELPPEGQAKVLEKVWNKGKKGVVVVMPGTPSGYQQLMALRNQLIGMGAFIAAPCPHHKACPLKAGDWCHFSARLLRPSFHRDIKNAPLPYEDEKFCYLAALKEPQAPSPARIIRKPLKRSGHVTLDLCVGGEIKRETISRKDKKRHKAASKANWGDDWEKYLE